jgi:hypothetical protein
MENDIKVTVNPSWTSFQKIAFRFSFVFFILHEVFGEGTYIISFGFTRAIISGIFAFTEKIFLGPCKWLNDHVFHFHYVPLSYTTFTPVLRTVRDASYLLIAIVICVIWTFIHRKKSGYNNLFYKFSRTQVIYLSCIMFSYGILKVFPAQMRFPSFADLHRPLGDLSPFELIWTTLGYGTPYQVFSGLLETLGAVLILFRRTRLAGLLTIAIVLINVMLLNYTYHIGVLVFSFYLFLITIFLLAPYTPRLLNLLFGATPVMQFRNEIVPKRVKPGVSRILIGVFMTTYVFAHIYYTYDRYERGKANASKEYSIVKNYIVGNDTLKLIKDDTSTWQIWGEGVMNGKRLVTINTMKYGADKTYIISRDSSRQVLTLQPQGQKDSTALTFNYVTMGKATWHLTGTIGDKPVKVELERVNPDTMLNLLKIKRNVIDTDDSAPY